MKLALSICITILLAFGALATPLLEVHIPDRTARHELVSGGFDILHVDRTSAHVLGWPGDAEELDALGLAYSVLVENLEAHYASRLDGELDDMGGYPTADEVYVWMWGLIEDHPDLVSYPETIGETYEGRPIYSFMVSDNPDQDEDEVELYINAAIHAREVVTPWIIMAFVDLLTDNYGTDDRITALVNERELHFTPIVNPDGYTYNEETNPNGGGMWRKNRRPPNGVDLNRNFPYMWGLDDSGSSPDPYDATYRGPEPGSENETQAMMDYINAHEFVAVINYHSYSNLILIPWGYTYEHHYEHDLYMAWSEYMMEPLPADWEAGNAEVLYATNGSAHDWQAAGGLEDGADYEMYSFTFEVGSSQDGGFWPPADVGEELVEEQMEPLLRFCEVGENPYLLMPPVPPVMAELPDTVGTSFQLSWTHEDPAGNDAVSFDVAELASPLHTDGAEADYPFGWMRDGFNRSTTFEYEGNYSYYSGRANNLNNTMTTQVPYEVQAGDAFTFYTWFNIEEDWDYAYVRISTDGGSSWQNLGGNITTNTNPNGSNQGNGITGRLNTTETFEEAIFPLDDYVGEQALFQLAYITDTYVNEQGLYADNIEPVTVYEEFSLIASDVPEPSYALAYEDLEAPAERFYAVRAQDAQEDLSKWSNVTGTIIQPVIDDVPGTQSELPRHFVLEAPSPNPFNPSTSLRVALPRAAQLQLEVYDVLGRRVQALELGRVAAGWQALSLNGQQWPSGVYFVQVRAIEENGTAHRAMQKAVLLK